MTTKAGDLTYENARTVVAAHEVTARLCRAHAELAAALVREAMTGADRFRADVRLPDGIAEATAETRALVDAMMQGSVLRTVRDAALAGVMKDDLFRDGALALPFVVLRDLAAEAIAAEPEVPTLDATRAALTADRPN